MKVFKVICALFVFGFVSVYHAAVIFITEKDAGGNVTSLLGADNVEVNGLFYNVRFIDGSCIALFNDCDDPADFFFLSAHDSIRATEDLLAQVFNDRTIFGEFPALTSGCEDVSFCNVFTPYELFNSNRVIGYAAVNRSFVHGGGVDLVVSTSGPVFFDSVVLSSYVYAVWSKPVEASAPGTAMVLLMGIAGLIVSQRRKQA